MKLRKNASGNFVLAQNEQSWFQMLIRGARTFLQSREAKKEFVRKLMDAGIISKDLVLEVMSRAGDQMMEESIQGGNPEDPMKTIYDAGG